MDLSTDKIPNKMLTGDELLEIAVKECRDMLSRDWAFTRAVAYTKAAFTLQATFHLPYPAPKDTVVRSRVRPAPAEDGQAPVITGEVPLPDAPEDAVVVGLERDVVIDNPNIARIGHDLPITVQERTPPQSTPVTGGIPGETPGALTNPFPQVVTHHLKYDKAKFPAGPAPVDRDISEAKGRELGAKSRKKE